MASKDQQRCRLTANVCYCELGSISRPTDYQKSVLTSHPQRCAVSGKSGSHRAVTQPPQILCLEDFLRRLVYDLKGQAGCEQRCVNMLNSASSLALA